MNKRVLFSAIGAVLGYAYFVFVGCKNGCAITGSPINSTVYGALVGLVWSWPTKTDKE
jgi:hypothetical protein